MSEALLASFKSEESGASSDVATSLNKTQDFVPTADDGTAVEAPRVIGEVEQQTRFDRHLNQPVAASPIDAREVGVIDVAKDMFNTDSVYKNLQEAGTRFGMNSDNPEGQQDVQDNLEWLMEGVPEEYTETISSQNNMESATFQANLIKDRIKAQERGEIASPYANLVGGMLGFVADPMNLLAVGAVYKGANVATRAYKRLELAIPALMNTTGRMHGTKTAIAQLAVLGGTEELIRELPRLAQDPTFKFDDYLMQAKYGFAFGAVFAGGAKALSPFTTKATAIIKSMDNAAVRIKADSAKQFVSALATNAKEGGVIKTMKSPIDAITAASNTAREKVRENMHTIDKKFVTEPIAKAKTPEELVTAADSSITKIKEAVNTASGKDVDLFEEAEIEMPNGVPEPKAEPKPDTEPKVELTEQEKLVKAAKDIDKQIMDLDKQLQTDELAAKFGKEKIVCEV